MILRVPAYWDINRLTVLSSITSLDLHSQVENALTFDLTKPRIPEILIQNFLTTLTLNRLIDSPLYRSVHPISKQCDHVKIQSRGTPCDIAWSITIIGFKMTCLKFHSNLPGAKEIRMNMINRMLTNIYFRIVNRNAVLRICLFRLGFPQMDWPWWHGAQNTHSTPPHHKHIVECLSCERLTFSLR